ncbi:MAG: pyridoxal kinase [Rhodospirillaceae bacterium]|nr:pyridoxal kinase [Rhodospirillaceae bacterium]
MSVLSIQSGVAVGHVGNSAATPALQRLGHAVWRVDTVSFSNHPAHGAFTGRVHPADEVGRVIEGIGALTGWVGCSGVLSGYLGAAGTAAEVARAVDAVKVVEPQSIYCCDPVIGDDGRVFVAEGVGEAIATELIGRADILTPNLFELAWLVGRDLAAGDIAAGDIAADNIPSILSAASELRQRGAGSVVVTGIEAGDRISTIVLDADGAWQVSARRFEHKLYGAGDLFAALLVGWRLKLGDLPSAVVRAVAGMEIIAEATSNAGGGELALLANLGHLADASRMADIERV